MLKTILLWAAKEMAVEVVNAVADAVTETVIDVDKEHDGVEGSEKFSIAKGMVMERLQDKGIEMSSGLMNLAIETAVADKIRT